MKNKHLTFRFLDNYIIVFYKDKQLFKVSNTINNAVKLCQMCK